jgi:hypothetical protein
MDPYTHGAYGRIQLFLADLHLVLGSMPHAPYGPPPILQPLPYANPYGGHLPFFNQIHLSGQLQRSNGAVNLRARGFPTCRSRSWKRNYQHNHLEDRVSYLPSIQQSSTRNFQKKQYVPREMIRKEVQVPRTDPLAATQTYNASGQHLLRQTGNTYDPEGHYYNKEDLENSVLASARSESDNNEEDSEWDD